MGHDGGRMGGPGMGRDGPRMGGPDGPRMGGPDGMRMGGPDMGRMGGPDLGRMGGPVSLLDMPDIPRPDEMARSEYHYTSSIKLQFKETAVSDF